MGAVLEGHDPYTWEWPCKRGFWEVIACDFALVMWIQAFKTIRPTFHKLARQQDLVWRPLHHAPQSQFLLINRSRGLSMQKVFPFAVLRITLKLFFFLRYIGGFCCCCFCNSDYFHSAHFLFEVII